MALIVRNNGVSLKKKDEIYPRPQDQANRLFHIAQDDTILERALFPKEFEINSFEGLTTQLKSGYNNMTISIDNDITVNETLLIPANKTVTLNLGEDSSLASTTRVFNVKGNLTINGGLISSDDRTIVVSSGGQLTINNTNIVSTTDNAITITGTNSALIINSGELVAREFGVSVRDGATVIINDGYLKGLDNFGLGGNGHKYVDSQGNLTSDWTEGETKPVDPINVIVNGGIIEGNIISDGWIATAIHWPNNGTLTLNGGLIHGACGIVQRGGTININPGVQILADGITGVKGKAGDSRTVVGPYAIVYDQQSNYPDAANMHLNISENVILSGTDGDIDILEDINYTPDIHDEREIVEIPFNNYQTHVNLNNINPNNAQIIRGSYVYAGLEDEKVFSSNYLQYLPASGDLVFDFKHFTITLNCSTGDYVYVEKE